MNTFNKKSLCVAIAATGLLGGAAQAVNLSEDGTGNVLVYPYYTVRVSPGGNTYNTYINLTNSTASTKAVKVRFREGKNSAEVLDFNVFLSPWDMWTGAVTPTADGAAVISYDKSCTIPSLRDSSGNPAAIPFRNLRYSGSSDDGGGTSLDRTREGYVEVFEMATYLPASVVAINALHSQTTGNPVDCNKVTDIVAAAEQQAPTGGLFGSLQLINPGAGASMSVNAVALDNFYPAGLGFYANTGSALPTMNDAAPNSAVKAGTALTVSTGWAQGADAVSAVMMHSAVMNEFILDAGTLSKTDWVVTFPTKRFYVSPGTGAAKAPFQRNFSGKSCDDIGLLLWDREERTPIAQPGPGPDFSPRDPVTPLVPGMCWEANVVTFNTPTGLGLLGSSNVGINVNTNLSSSSDIAQNGWMEIGFVNAAATLTNANTVTMNLNTGAATAPAAATYVGLPVVGFNVWTYTNSALKVGNVTSNVPTNYGMGTNHKYRTTIK